jgi:hypothetical protein
MGPAWPCPFGATGRVAKNDAKGTCVVRKSDRAKGPGREAWHFLTDPCLNLHGSNELNERFKLADGKNPRATSSRALP